ncbi:MAG: hypothetical protein ABJO02_15550 [Reichenbachiella sp.]|uniref:hypothetical protein n=1 Tax=Reichenbachiella sp. TaxID=2184521 RepID=UPI003298E3AE
MSQNSISQTLSFCQQIVNFESDFFVDWNFASAYFIIADGDAICTGYIDTIFGTFAFYGVILN